MSTCNRLDLQTLGSQPVMPKNLPDRCYPGVTLTTLYFMCQGVVDMMFLLQKC